MKEDHSDLSPLRIAKAANSSARAVSRSSNSRAEEANLLCFFAALICLNGKLLGRTRGDDEGGETETFLRGGESLGRPSVEVDATRVEEVGEESADEFGMRGTKGLIGGCKVDEGGLTSGADAEEVRR